MAFTDGMAPLLEHLSAPGAARSTIPISAAGVDMRGYSVSGKASGKCLTATVWADGPPSVEIATIGVALHSRCGATLWRDLHRYASLPAATQAGRCPPEPWVAAAIDRGALAMGHLPAMEWMGDFERCLAWAFARGRYAHH